ncbi:glycosyltransferase family 2 protein [Mastigocoleus testarum]|uniref:Glycosyltransferase n=1 Tax=Mastigocoleus testarum BC008 TaxID=371196 RepID=A0A0V7ZRT6_9CYAN|nr:glycosyltransferase [Mastigocoleus testarum]KST67360.1 glycosyltransferase [Mastigocoleus testarum BC008]
MYANFRVPTKINKLHQLQRKQGFKRLLKYLYQRQVSSFKEKINYQKWIAKNLFTKEYIATAKEEITQWKLRPKFSVIIPVYNVEEKWLEKAIGSVRNQIYPYWELCIADDASSKPHISLLLNKYIEIDSRIKVVFRTENGHISAASNSALELATGDYIALLDHDDELAINALYENAKLINQHPDADFIYSDEDKIDIKGKRFSPCFKPDWSPEYLYATMYTCHLGVYRRSIIHEIGGFRSEYDGSQDYDLALRVVEKTKNIYHIPKILYHWRSIPASAASGSEAKPWAYTGGRKALEDMLVRNSQSGTIEETPNPGIYRLRRGIVGQPLVSIIIPSAGIELNTSSGNLCLLENCIRSIQKLSTYKNYEIIVVDGYDIPESTLKKITTYGAQLVRCGEPFNFSMRINKGANQAKGEFLLLLNDDTEIISPDWLESMLEVSQQKEVGAVGAKLLSPDGKIQHTGTVILDGNPCHVFYGCDSEHPGYHCSNIVTRNYLAVTAACLMMRQEVFGELGGLDESFPLNYNDVDLCLKAHQAGYRNVVTSYAQLIHYESISRGKGLKPGEFQQFNRKWQDYLQRLGKDPYYNPNLSYKSANYEILC